MNGLDLVLSTSLFTALLALLGGDRPVVGRLLVALYGLQLLQLAGLYPALLGGGTVDSGLALQFLGNTLHWSMSGLGWYFALVTVGAAVFSAWYAAGDWARAHGPMRLFHTALALNVLAMLVLLSSADLLSLFIGWELVSWASYLIMTQRGSAAAKAAYRYLVYAMGGAMALLAGIVLVQVRFGGIDFATVRDGLGAATDGLNWAVLLLIGGGFAVKMALVPFHLWQANAYAETPGPAAAFLGAISSRMGLFGLAILAMLVGLGRLAEMAIPFTFLDARTLLAWVAAITIVVPTFIALTQTDARRLLAWHGIGQGGYMLLGLMVATPMGVAGGLLHVFNHATYQAALFLSVSAVLYRTGTTDLDKLGGLITRMPLSYVTMLMGIIGLAGLPPMNGFVSKWLIYKSLLDAHMPLLLVAAVAGTLGTILSVYKLIHNTFLGQLRREHLEIREAPLSMTVPMLALGGIAFITGWMPGLALDLVDIAQSAMGLPLLPHHLGGVTTANGSLNMLWVVSILLVAIGIGAVVFFLGNRSHRVHQLDNYAGGHFLTADTRYQYSHNFYPGLMRVIGPLYRGSIQSVENGTRNFTGLLAGAMHGFYRTAYSPIYLLVAVVAGLWLWI